MSAPKRWLDETGTDDRAARDLLRSAASLDPPPGAQAQVWAALIAQLPPGAPGGDGGASGGSAGGGALPAGAGKAALAGAAGGGMIKSALIGAGSAIALVAAYTAVAPASAPETTPPLPTIAIAVTSAPARLPSNPRPLPSVDPAPTAAPSAIAPIEARPADLRGNGSATPTADPSPVAAPDLGPEASAAEKESRLREESQRLGEARDALRRGDAPGALARLDELRRRFPTGVLVQEREALTIEALSRSGNAGEARARAETFHKAYPASPHKTRIDALTAEPPAR